MRFIDFRVYSNKKNGQISLIPKKKQLNKANIKMPDKIKVPLDSFKKWLIK